MEFESKIGKIVDLTEERKNHILEYHPDVKVHLSKKCHSERQRGIPIKLAQDPSLSLGMTEGKVVVKINKRNFVLTCYLTDRIKTGEKIYER